MRLQKPLEHDPYYYLYLTDDIFIHSINDWEQIFGRWNWYTFHLLHVYFEKDVMCGGYEFEFAVLGLGFRMRINDPESDGYKTIHARIKDLETERKGGCTERLKDFLEEKEGAKK